MFEISNEIVGGKMNGNDHFWLNILEYDNVILDATIQQFDKSQVRTYVGELKENEITMQYDLKPYSLNDWLRIYENWSFPECCAEILINGNEEFFRKVVKHNLINASLLISQLEKENQNTQQRVKNTYLFKMYFNSIFNSLKNRWIEDDDLIKSVREKVELEFEVLLSKIV